MEPLPLWGCTRLTPPRLMAAAPLVRIIDPAALISEEVGASVVGARTEPREKLPPRLPHVICKQVDILDQSARGRRIVRVSRGIIGQD